MTRLNSIEVAGNESFWYSDWAIQFCAVFMLQNLTPEERRLADYMSALSEKAYFAGWMEGLEFALWEAMNGQKKQYGCLVFSKEELETLRTLSEAVGGWIVFDDTQEETFVRIEDWKTLYNRERDESENPPG